MFIDKLNQKLEAIDAHLILPYESELIDSLRKITYLGIPASIVVLSFPVRNGQCHLIAMILTHGMSEFKLIRGNINEYPIEDEFPNHSWIEKDGYVYDPTDGFKYERDLYYELYNPKIIEEYDEQTLQRDTFYQKLESVLNKKQLDSNALALTLQYLEELELKEPTVNHTALLDEIQICRDLYDAKKVYSKKTMKKYNESMQ